MLFDAYMMVDWSAAGVPRTGRDSIWVHVLDARGDRLALDNPATRTHATDLIADWAKRLAARGRRLLVGFDFPFGYPAGLAACLGTDGWRAVWDHLTRELDDRDDNANDRFRLAADLNRRLSDGPAPFWGCPEAAAGPYLASRRAAAGCGLPARRVVERRVPSASPTWKLYTTGSVGSQMITGIPRVAALRRDPELAPVTRIWPFETGLAAPARGVGVVLAEIYPSLVPPARLPGFPKDAGQVVAIAEHFRGLDQTGRLAAAMAGPSDLAADERRLVETEEAWILGVGDPEPAPEPPPTDAAQIYRVSFARVRAATALGHLPGELHPLALRLVHTTADPAIVEELAAAPGAVAAARAALASGAPILCDAEMVAAGITRRFLTADNPVLCPLNDPAVPGLAERLGLTRSAAAVELWRPHLAGAVVAVGNAPTALARLLELIARGAPRPAAILGFAVGFVGATEAKAALMAQRRVPWIALGGRRGGSALAAAAVNALARGEPEDVAP